MSLCTFECSSPPTRAMNDGVSNVRPTTISGSGGLPPIPLNPSPSSSPKTAGSPKGVKSRGGWDNNYFQSTSMDSLPGTAGTGRVLRRYNFGNTARSSGEAVDKRLPQLSHFDVRMNKLTFASKLCCRASVP